MFRIIGDTTSFIGYVLFIEICFGIVFANRGHIRFFQSIGPNTSNEVIKNESIMYDNTKPQRTTKIFNQKCVAYSLINTTEFRLAVLFILKVYLGPTQESKAWLI